MGGASAVDIITYVGIPLAVLGVLPTIYTCLKSFITLRDIRHLLDRNGVTAITRSSLLSGIIEVEIPRKSIIPLEREDPPYFEVSETYSTLKGGSWTLLNWRELSIGVKSYRFQYHDELRQPQAEAEFEHLVAYLLDLGAVPSQEGFSDLRSSGLWTPAGTKLMLSPSTADAVLSVTTSEDSDGILSLALDWRHEWNRRGIHDLPPYWMRLVPPVRCVTTPPAEEGESNSKTYGNDGGKEEKGVLVDEAPSTGETQNESGLTPQAVEAKSGILSLSIEGESKNLSDKGRDASSFLSPEEDDPERSISIRSFRQSYDSPIRLRLGSSGLEEASYEDLPTKRIRFPHLRSYHNEPNSRAMWFACAVTALGAPCGGLWAYGITEDIVALSKRESIPGGVMVLLDLIPEDSVPTWRTPFDNKMEEHEQWLKQQKFHERTFAEMKMTPEERAKAWHARVREENMERIFEQRRKEVEAEQHRESEIKEALGSQRLSATAVGQASRLWLIKKKYVDVDADLTGVVERMLWEMVKTEEMARSIADMLDEWKRWAEGGGMTKSQFEKVKEDQLTFAYAACVLTLIGQTSGTASGSIVSDLQECLRMWKKVRLG